MSKRSVMSRKAFHIAIDFDVHAVTCPGVWLCPKGMVMLRVTMLGVTEHTKKIEPIFPLLFHERFHFRKMFPEASSLSELTEALKRINTHIELIQIQENKCKGKLLASFKRSMAEVLSPTPADKGLVAGVDVDLLMEATDCFPGILAPKVEVSTRVVIEEVINFPVYESWVINPVTVCSCKPAEDKGTKDKICKEQKSLVRQKRVCHRKRKPRCVCCKPNFDSTVKSTEKQKAQNAEIIQEPRRKPKKGTGNKCYCCQRCGKELNVENHGEVIVKEDVKERNKYDNICPCNKTQLTSSKTSCDCRLCLKYNHVFSCSCDSAQDNTPLDSSSLKGYPCSPSPVLPRKKVDSQCCGSGKPSAYQPRRHSPARMRHCFCKEPVNCCCKSYSLKKPANPWLDTNETDTLWKQDGLPTSHRQIFYSNLESYYRKMYERICKKNNQEASHCIC